MLCAFPSLPPSFALLTDCCLPLLSPATVHQSYPHHATQLHPHQPQQATTPTGNQQQAQHAAPSPVQVPRGRHNLSVTSMGGTSNCLIHSCTMHSLILCLGLTLVFGVSLSDVKIQHCLGGGEPFSIRCDIVVSIEGRDSLSLPAIKGSCLRIGLILILYHLLLGFRFSSSCSKARTGFLASSK